MLAKEASCTFISIQHSNFNTEEHFYTRSAELRDFVLSRQAIIVNRDENAKAYHNAVEELLNTLGVLLPARSQLA
jgi:hypothetical protein